jgi:hypothetical protein
MKITQKTLRKNRRYGRSNKAKIQQHLLIKEMFEFSNFVSGVENEQFIVYMERSPTWGQSMKIYKNLRRLDYVESSVSL